MTKEWNLEQYDTYTEAPVEEPERQFYYMAKCQSYVKEFTKKTGHVPTCCVTTFGCQMNTEHEIEKAA